MIFEKYVVLKRVNVMSVDVNVFMVIGWFVLMS